MYHTFDSPLTLPEWVGCSEVTGINMLILTDDELPFSLNKSQVSLFIITKAYEALEGTKQVLKQLSTKNNFVLVENKSDRFDMAGLLLKFCLSSSSKRATNSKYRVCQKT
jgi:hypothetical protein